MLGSDFTNTLQCQDCEAKMSPMEAYGTDRDTCPNPSCRGDLGLTEKGREMAEKEFHELLSTFVNAP